MEAHSLKGSIPRTCTKVFEEFRKVHEIASRASVINDIFNKVVDMQYLC